MKIFNEQIKLPNIVNEMTYYDMAWLKIAVEAFIVPDDESLTKFRLYANDTATINFMMKRECSEFYEDKRLELILIKIDKQEDIDYIFENWLHLIFRNEVIEHKLLDYKSKFISEIQNQNIPEEVLNADYDDGFLVDNIPFLLPGHVLWSFQHRDNLSLYEQHKEFQPYKKYIVEEINLNPLLQKIRNIVVKDENGKLINIPFHQHHKSTGWSRDDIYSLFLLDEESKKDICKKRMKILAKCIYVSKKMEFLYKYYKNKISVTFGHGNIRSWKKRGWLTNVTVTTPKRKYTFQDMSVLEIYRLIKKTILKQNKVHKCWNKQYDNGIYDKDHIGFNNRDGYIFNAGLPSVINEYNRIYR